MIGMEFEAVIAFKIAEHRLSSTPSYQLGSVQKGRRHAYHQFLPDCEN